MGYDPTKPANNSPLDAAEMRDQFTGLKELIDLQMDFDDTEGLIMAESANNLGALPTLGLTVSNPPTQAQVQAIADKVDALILALRR